MSISYPVDVQNTLWSVINVNTGEIVARNKKWPVADGGPINGQDPNYEYLLQVESAPPDYDGRLFYLRSNEIPDIPSNTITKTSQAIKRSTADQKIAAENVEAQQLQLHIDLAKEVLQTRFALTAIIKHAIDGETLSPKIQNILNAYAAKGVKLYQNRNRLEEILADIDNGIEPDLDAGWQPAE